MAVTLMSNIDPLELRPTYSVDTTAILDALAQQGDPVQDE